MQRVDPAELILASCGFTGREKIMHTGTATVRVNDRDKEVPFAIDDDLHLAPRCSIGILLAHGAGGDMTSGNLPAFAAALSTIGPCLRFTARGPLAHRVAVAKALLAAPPAPFPTQSITRWIVAGHSMGGRVAVQLADELSQDSTIAACLLLSYPLHPPGRPTELRDVPLCDLDLPIMFVRGTKDPFSTKGPWTAVRQRLKAATVEVHEVDGGDHGLRISGATAEENEAALQAALDAAVAFASRVAEEGPENSKGTKRKPRERKNITKKLRKK